MFISENKIAHYPEKFGTVKVTRALFRYKVHNIYNALPPNLTIARSYPIFKKWLNVYHLNKDVNIPDLSKPNIIKPVRNMPNQTLQSNRIMQPVLTQQFDLTQLSMQNVGHGAVLNNHVDLSQDPGGTRT